MAGEYGFEFDYGYDDEQVHRPYCHLVGAGVLGKIVRLLSFPVTVSCNEGAVMPNAENDMAENASYSRTL